MTAKINPKVECPLDSMTDEEIREYAEKGRKERRGDYLAMKRQRRMSARLRPMRFGA